MKKHIIDLFKQDGSVTEIKAANNIRYILMHNLLLEVDNTVVTDVAIMHKAAAESSTFYYYDLLVPKCIESDVDFSFLLIELLDQGISTDDLIDFED